MTVGRGGGAAVAAWVGAEGREPHGPALVPDTGQWSLLHREVGHYQHQHTLFLHLYMVPQHCQTLD